MKIPENHKLISFEVAALYPSVPQEEALRLFEEELFQDRELKTKTPITASPGARGQFWTNWGANSNLPRVVGICLKFQKKYVSKAEFSCKCVFCRPE